MLHIISLAFIGSIFVLTLLVVCKRTRVLGKWLGYSMATALVLLALVYGYFMRPISMQPAPTVDAQAILHSTKTTLDKLDFYLGSGTYTPEDIQHPAFAGFFNSYSSINELKIGSVLRNPQDRVYDFSQADIYIEQAQKYHLRIRGHALVFGKLSDVYERPNLQTWLDAHYTDATQKRNALQNLVDHHIETMLTHYKGRINQWDVVNEPLGLFGQGSLEDNVFLRNLGVDYIANAFIRAHAVDNQAKLFLNEQFDRYTGPRADAFITLVQQLKAQGVPVHGVGLQHHMLFTLSAAEEIKIFIERLAAIGVEVEITELDARLRLFADSENPHLAQAEYYRDIVKTCYSLNACKGVTFWGLHDVDAWHKELPWMFPKPNAPYLFDEKKNAKIAVQLLGEEIARWEPRQH
jgi:endo-1,4-beta-xylanase